MEIGMCTELTSVVGLLSFLYFLIIPSRALACYKRCAQTSFELLCKSTNKKFFALQNKSFFVTSVLYLIVFFLYFLLFSYTLK